MIDFNINESVLVRLTEVGKDELLRQEDELRKTYPKLGAKLPDRQEDDDGFTKWQLWSLINTFGHMVGMALPLPFESDIKLDK